jgi:hypothetical protein
MIIDHDLDAAATQDPSIATRKVLACDTHIWKSVGLANRSDNTILEHVDHIADQTKQIRQA